MVISQKMPVKKWTWADLQSSYRFWGLVFYFVAFGFSQYFFSTTGLLFIKANSDMSMADIGMVHGTQQAGLFFGAILAWVASRIKNYYMLYLFSGLVLLGFYLFSSNSGNVEVLVIAEFLIGLGIGAMLLIIPAFIAGAIGSVEAFVLAFGMLVTLKFGFNIVMMPIFSYLYTRHTSSCMCVGFPRSPQSLTCVSSWGFSASPPSCNSNYLVYILLRYLKIQSAFLP